MPRPHAPIYGAVTLCAFYLYIYIFIYIYIYVCDTCENAGGLQVGRIHIYSAVFVTSKLLQYIALHR